MKKALFLILIGLMLQFSHTEAALAQVGSGELLGIYPKGAEVIWPQVKDAEINGTKAKINLYDVFLGPQQVVKFYEQALSPKGWAMKETWENIEVTHFSNGQEHLYLMMTPGAKTRVFVCASSQPLYVCIQFNPDDYHQEIPGKDLSSVPRYPNSVRRGSVIRQDEKEAMLDYVTFDEPEEVLDFFRNNLEDYGWRFVANDIPVPVEGAEERMQAVNMLFQGKDNDTLIIMIFRAPESQAAVITMFLNVAEARWCDR